jgi:hypothetical protein
MTSRLVANCTDYIEMKYLVELLQYKKSSLEIAIALKKMRDQKPLYEILQGRRVAGNGSNFTIAVKKRNMTFCIRYF